jgi:hypothetical protein
LDTVGATCRARRRDGQPCTVKALDDGYCFAHSPRLAEKRKAAHAAGGRNSATKERMARKVTASGLSQIEEVLKATIAGTLQGRIDPRKASAVASLSGVYVRCYQVSVVEAEQAELAARLERLEEASNARRAF